MYIDWYLAHLSYDLVIKSWKCHTNSRATYWAVHQWSNGYAGFQNVSDNNSTDNQKWKIENISGVSYLYPKNALSMNMDIEGPSYLENAKIQIWTHHTSATQFQWTIC